MDPSQSKHHSLPVPSPPVPSPSGTVQTVTVPSGISLVDYQTDPDRTGGVHLNSMVSTQKQNRLLVAAPSD